MASKRRSRRTARDAASIRKAQAKQKRAAWRALPPKCRREVLRWLRGKAELYEMYPGELGPFIAAMRAGADFLEAAP